MRLPVNISFIGVESPVTFFAKKSLLSLTSAVRFQSPQFVVEQVQTSPAPYPLDVTVLSPHA
jgi:hypothetical protein